MGKKERQLSEQFVQGPNCMNKSIILVCINTSLSRSINKVSVH